MEERSTEFPRFPMLSCTVHCTRREILRIVCLNQACDHSKLLCRHCAVENHRGHDTIELHQLVEELEDYSIHSIPSGTIAAQLSAVKDAHMKCIKVISALRRQLGSQLDDLEAELKQHFDILQSQCTQESTAPSPAISALLQTNMGTSITSVGNYASKLVSEFIRCQKKRETAQKQMSSRSQLAKSLEFKLQDAVNALPELCTARFRQFVDKDLLRPPVVVEKTKKFKKLAQIEEKERVLLTSSVSVEPHVQPQQRPRPQKIKREPIKPKPEASVSNPSLVLGTHAASSVPPKTFSVPAFKMASLGKTDIPRNSGESIHPINDPSPNLIGFSAMWCHPNLTIVENRVEKNTSGSHTCALGKSRWSEQTKTNHTCLLRIVAQRVQNCGVCVGIAEEGLAMQYDFDLTKLISNGHCYMLNGNGTWHKPEGDFPVVVGSPKFSSGDILELKLNTATRELRISYEDKWSITYKVANIHPKAYRAMVSLYFRGDAVEMVEGW